MRIQYLDRCYEVIQKIRSTPALDVCVARYPDGGEWKTCTVVCVYDRELARNLILVTTKKNTSLAFQDLLESFNIGGTYYIVFRYMSGEALVQALTRHEYNFRERLLLLKNLFGRILLLNMPDCFLYEVLRKDNIIVDEALQVGFQYAFTEVEYYWQVEENHCVHRIGELVQDLFQKELTEKSVRELEEYARNLTQGKYEDIWSCYEAYHTLYDRLLQRADSSQIRPGRIWWRAWEAFKAWLPVWKSVLAVLLILISGVYLLLHLPNPVQSEDGITFAQIGTLEIKGQEKEKNMERAEGSRQEQPQGVSVK